MSKPVAVCISDIHFNLNTLQLASQALRAALLRAETLQVPLIIAGDLNDSKAIIRAEVANEIIDILEPAKTRVYILVGNHDLINEKGIENGLNYLRPYADIVSSPVVVNLGGWNLLGLIPYQSDNNKIKEFLDEKRDKPPSLKTLVMHQGFLGAAMGDYIQDKTSIDPEIVKDFTVISGHYHRHQTIGTVTYIGSPFTMSFGESNDGPKGFLILNDDGTFTREILDLRKHIKMICDYKAVLRLNEFKRSVEYDNDLLWLKVSGPQSELIKLDKKWIGERLLGHSNYKLDLIPTDPVSTTIDVENLTSNAVFDTLIDSITESAEQKQYLKELWRSLI